MLKKFSFLLAILLFVFSFAYAETMSDEATIGGRDTSGNYRWRVDSSGNLLPGATASYDIGDGTHYVDNAYITTNNVGTETITTANITTGNITTGNITTANLTTTNIAGNILPTTSHTRNIGSATYEISGIYADGATVDSLVAGTADIDAGTVDGATIGANSASSGAFTTLAYSGLLSPGANSGYKINYEVFTTGDTLTAAETGKYVITNLDDADGIVDFVLPAKATGLEYKFVSGRASIIRIDPNGSDHIYYAALDQGDRIASGTSGAADGASGDSITLISDGNAWYVAEMNPDDWADAN